ncbi:MAG: cache domain-containing protein [Caulobacterales bacterium]|nr:cache domain-containing protein [Caulobacterales bacterium]MCA0371437.1 cache domain-containing protein [Pseudomonadota bacterium]
MKFPIKLENISLNYKLLGIIIIALSAMTVGTLFALIDSRFNMIKDRRNMTLHSVEVAQSIVNSNINKQKNGTLSIEQAQKETLETIKSLRYDANNYYFIIDKNSKMIMHPLSPELDGKDVSQIKDLKGKLIYKNMVDVVNKQKNGHIEYSLAKPNYNIKKAFPVISYVSQTNDWGWIIGTSIYIDDVNAEFFKAITKFGTLLLIAGILYVWVGVYIGNDIKKSLNEISNGIDTLADAKKLYLKINDRQDEAGQMARGLLHLDKKLHEARELEQAQLQNAQLKIAEQQKLEREITNFEAKTQKILQLVNDYASNLYEASEHMGNIVSDVNLRAQKVAGASSETSDNIQNVASAAKEMSNSVQQISQQTDYFENVIRDAVYQTQQADKTSIMLEQAALRIGEIVEIIQKIAGQINLLALNATIESARAGEAGRGFAVVANEVKSLANQTENATHEISQNIDNIKNVSTEVIKSLGAIKTSIDSVCGISNKISTAVNEQSSATQNIAQNMQHASSGTHMIDASINEVSEFSLEANKSAIETKEAAKLLSQNTKLLSQEISVFLDNVRAA